MEKGAQSWHGLVFGMGRTQVGMGRMQVAVGEDQVGVGWDTSRPALFL